jgi:hypothetical protein
MDRWKATLKGERGWGKGPLSPYLFVLAMEVFSRLMDDYASQNRGFRFHYRCLRLRFSHLCFADDFLIFLIGKCEFYKCSEAGLEEFESLSGLKVNLDKSTILCSGTSDMVKDR